MKKLLSILLSAVIFVSVFGSLPVFANAAKVVTSGSSLDCDWNFNTETGELTITAVRNNGEMFDYEIEEGEGYPEWHAYKDLIKTVTIEDGVSRIGSYSFSGCKNLKIVTIPCSVNIIGGNAFSGCINLTEVEFAERDKKLTIQWWAFSSCKKLTSITIPDSVSYIGGYAFSSTPLTNIDIPNGVRYIGDRAFAWTSLTNVNIPESIQIIGRGAFCTKKLQSINVDENNKNYCDINGNLYNKKQTKFMQYTCGKKRDKFTIPNTVKTIMEGAFGYGEKLNKLVIPTGITKIEYFAFNHTLNNIKYLGTSKQFEKVKKDKDDILVSCKFKPKHKKNVFHINETDRLKVTSNISTKDNATTFKSSNPKVMRVSKHGKVRALKKGKVTITVKRNGGIVKKKVTVKS